MIDYDKKTGFATVTQTSIYNPQVSIFNKHKPLYKLIVKSGKTFGADGDNYIDYIPKKGHLPTGSQIRTVILPDELKIIGYNAFFNCKSLVYIKLPRHLEKIKRNAFYGCSSLRFIEISEQLPNMEDAFYECANLHTVIVPDYCTEKDKTIKQYFIDHVNKEIKILHKSEIMEYCRSDHSLSVGIMPYFDIEMILDEYPSTESLIIRPGVTSIGEIKSLRTCEVLSNWWGGSKKLKTVSLPEGLTSLGNGSFCNCSKLDKINCPESLQKIGSYSFENCNSLNNISLPKTLTHIGTRAFKNCENLESISLPNSVTNIGDSAFEKCSSLKEIVLPSSLENLGDNAFRDCKSLVSVTVPESLLTLKDRINQQIIDTRKKYGYQDISLIRHLNTCIGTNLFEGCTSLTAIYCLTNSKELLNKAANLLGVDKKIIKAFNKSSTSKRSGVDNVMILTHIPPLDRWKEMELVSDPDSAEEQANTFYMWKNIGCEVENNDKFNAYAIITDEDHNETPELLKEGFTSTNEVLSYFSTTRDITINDNGYSQLFELFVKENPNSLKHQPERFNALIRDLKITKTAKILLKNIIENETDLLYYMINLEDESNLCQVIKQISIAIGADISILTPLMTDFYYAVQDSQ